MPSVAEQTKEVFDDLTMDRDAYKRWSWYLKELLLSHNIGAANFIQFIKENDIPHATRNKHNV